MSNDYEPGECVRCGDLVTFVVHLYSGQPVYADVRGMYFCGDFHGHDEDGVFSPNHDVDVSRVRAEDATYFITQDDQDNCHFDEDIDEWIVPYNPFILEDSNA